MEVSIGFAEPWGGLVGFEGIGKVCEGLGRFGRVWNGLGRFGKVWERLRMTKVCNSRQKQLFGTGWEGLGRFGKF